MEPASMALVNVALTDVPAETPDAPAAGTTDITSGPVLCVHEYDSGVVSVMPNSSIAAT
jgi:hypothetical protein